MEEKKLNNEEIKDISEKNMIHIIVPDNVDINDATLKSTQKEECQKYEIDKEKLEDYSDGDLNDFEMDDEISEEDFSETIKAIKKIKNKESENNISEEKITHIIVPDTVDVNDATLKSTQKEECKKYEVDAERFKDYAENDEFEDIVDTILEDE